MDISCRASPPKSLSTRQRLVSYVDRCCFVHSDNIEIRLKLMLGLHITTMRYECQFPVIRGTFVTFLTKRNACGYSSQQIVSVLDICEVRGSCF